MDLAQTGTTPLWDTQTFSCAKVSPAMLVHSARAYHSLNFHPRRNFHPRHRRPPPCQHPVKGRQAAARPVEARQAAAASVEAMPVEGVPSRVPPDLISRGARPSLIAQRRFLGQ